MTLDIDGGLEHDLPRVLTRRAALTDLVGDAGLALLAACSSDSPSTAPTSTATRAGSTGGTEIPEETAGPFPGNGSNGKNVLTESGIVRSDIRSSFAGATGV